MEFLNEQILPHWPFVFMSLALGMIGQFTKTAVWTKARAAKSKLYFVMRASLPMHAACAGAFAGAFGAPVSPGVEGAFAGALYHFTAGAFSSWAYNALKHWAQSRGLQINNNVSMPPRNPGQE